MEMLRRNPVLTILIVAAGASLGVLVRLLIANTFFWQTHDRTRPFYAPPPNSLAPVTPGLTIPRNHLR